jgi:hypothetical protein
MGEGTMNTWHSWVQTLDKGKVISNFCTAALCL